MTEPTLTGQWKALVKRHGNIKLAIAGIRHYWKPITGTAATILGFGIFLERFHTLIESQKATTAALAALTARVGAVEQSEQKRSILEEAIRAAANITVTPVTTEPPQNAPVQEVRKDKVKP